MIDAEEHSRAAEGGGNYLWAFPYEQTPLTLKIVQPIVDAKSAASSFCKSYAVILLSSALPRSGPSL